MIKDPLGYPFIFPPYEHQQAEFDNHRNSKARALLWMMRTGKTKAVIDKACYNADLKRIDGVLVVAPNGVHLNWIFRELPAHHWKTIAHDKAAWVADDLRVKHKKARWLKAFSEVKAKNGKLSWLAVNCDAFSNAGGKKVIAEFMKSRKRVMLVVDESHEFGTPGSKRTRALRGLSKRSAFKMILSGTAVDESPLKAYSQYELLEPGALGFTRYSDFKERYCVEEERYNARTKTKFKAIDEYINQEELREKMAAWSSVVLREDCDDMPALVPGTAMFDMRPEQRKVFDELVDGMMQRLDSGEVIKPADGGALIIRLQQVRSGYAVDETGNIHELIPPKKNPALDALRGASALASGKAIIWCRFRKEIEAVSEALAKDGHKVVQYHGGVSTADRHRAIDSFQNQDKVTRFVGQPQAGGQGINLSAADDIMWFSHTFSAIQRNQANERATQIGGKRIGLTDLIGRGTPDERILDKLQEKADRSDFLAGHGLKAFLQAMLAA